MKRPISDISIGNRFRRDHGDLSQLAESIRQQGLLQPVGVTESDELVFGERRLRACRDILGWTEIDVRVVRVTSIVEGEHDENEVRKDFTTSEKVAIARALQKRMGDGRSMRQKNSGHGDTSPSGRVEDIAAKEAGFSSTDQYRRAKNVDDNGTEKLVAAMDRKEISIRTADTLAGQPADVQDNILSFPPPKRSREVTKIRRQTEEQRKKDHLRATAETEKVAAEIKANRANNTELGEVRAVIDALIEMAACSSSGHKLYAVALPVQQKELRSLVPVGLKILSEIEEATSHAKSAL